MAGFIERCIRTKNGDYLPLSKIERFTHDNVSGNVFIYLEGVSGEYQLSDFIEESVLSRLIKSHSNIDVPALESVGPLEKFREENTDNAVIEEQLDKSSECSELLESTPEVNNCFVSITSGGGNKFEACGYDVDDVMRLLEQARVYG